MFRRVIMIAAVTVAFLASITLAPGVSIARAQADPCAGLPAYARAMLAEEQRYTEQTTATLDLNDLQAIAQATPEQLTTIVEIIDQHLKNLDAIKPPAFAETWHIAVAEAGDLIQALFSDGAQNGIFSILVDYYDQSVRSDTELAEARLDATVACPDFDAFAAQFDLVDGEVDSPAPGFAAWSSCEGLDQLAIDIGRANLQALVDVPSAVAPLAEFAADWDVDPSIHWNQLQFFSLADYYDAVAGYLEQLTPPDYVAPWLEAQVAFDRALAALIRSAYGMGIIAASETGGGDLIVAGEAATASIPAATESCPNFAQFAESN